MSRYSKIVKRKKNAALFGFIPEKAQVFIARRLIDAVGLALLLAGLGFFVALLSYNHADPSWNTAAAGADVHNWLGVSGAHVADLFLQTLGGAGFIVALIFCVWGTRVLLRKSLAPLSLRLFSALLSFLLGAVALARIPAGAWMVHPYLGGSGGTIMLDRGAALIRPVTGGYEHLIVALVAGAVSLVAFFYAVTVTRAMVWSITVFSARKVGQGAQTAFFYLLAFYEWVRHYGDPDYVLPGKVKTIKKKAEKAKNEKITPPLSERVKTPAPRQDKKSIKVVEPKKEKASSSGPSTGRQSSFALDGGDWDLPTMDLLQEAESGALPDDLDQESLRQNAELLQNVLSDFNVDGEIVSIHPGPVVTLYEFEPAPGVKTSRIIGLSDDIARSMAAVSVRCAVVPGQNVIGIELPNSQRQTVYMREILEMTEVQKTKAGLPLILGKDIGGRPVVADLAKMPHLLVAGTTGSGKSVAVNTMILSLLYRLPPEKCRFIFIDPKMLELSIYNGIPHLLSPVVTEPGKAVVALKWAVKEMEDRYRAMSKLGVRNIEGYNERIKEALKKGETLMRKVQTGFDPETGKPVYEEQPLDMTELPYIVIVVDEFADLMLVAGKDVENAVQRLAQMARAAGIHLVMATQRPSTDVITGIIKANFPTRISFQVTSKIDSRVILNEGGAEQLLGMGDMLYMKSGGRLKRVHGPFVSDEDVDHVVSFLKRQGEPAYLSEVTEGGDLGDSDVMNALFEGGDSDADELYDEAVAIVAKTQKASTSYLQRRLQIGYNRAARIIDMMEEQGVISSADHVGRRDVLVGDLAEA